MRLTWIFWINVRQRTAQVAALVVIKHWTFSIHLVSSLLVFIGYSYIYKIFLYIFLYILWLQWLLLTGADAFCLQFIGFQLQDENCWCVWASAAVRPPCPRSGSHEMSRDVEVPSSGPRERVARIVALQRAGTVKCSHLEVWKHNSRSDPLSSS